MVSGCNGDIVEAASPTSNFPLSDCGSVSAFDALRVYAFGDAGFFGSAAGLRLAAPLVGIVGSPDGHGYWLFGRDGGVLAYGDAPYLGNAVGMSPKSPITSATA
jgi:hypothetical protein